MYWAVLYTGHVLGSFGHRPCIGQFCIQALGCTRQSDYLLGSFVHRLWVVPDFWGPGSATGKDGCIGVVRFWLFWFIIYLFYFIFLLCQI